VPAFGSVSMPVRTSQRIEVNDPDGYMTEPPGDLWWLGLHHRFTAAVPASVTRATAIIVNPLVRMPWTITGADGVKLEQMDRGYPAWLRDPMLLHGSTGGPNRGRFEMLDRIDRFDLWARWVCDALWYGTGVLLCELDSAGQPLAGSLHVIDPERLYRSDDAEHSWAIVDRRGQPRPIDEQGMVIGTGLRVVPLRHSLPGGVFGRHRAELQLSLKVRQYASDTFDSSVPSGVLTTDQPITQDQADVVRLEMERTQLRRRIAVLGNGAQYKQVTMSPLDAEIVAMTRLSNEQVAHMFELPAWQLDASTNSNTYSNALDWRQDLVDGPLASWSARLEETLGALLPWTSSLDVDFTQYTKPMTTTDVPEAPSGTAHPSDPARV